MLSFCPRQCCTVIRPSSYSTKIRQHIDTRSLSLSLSLSHTHTHTYTHTHTDTHAHTHSHWHTRILTHTLSHTRTHTYTHVHTPIQRSHPGDSAGRPLLGAWLRTPPKDHIKTVIYVRYIVVTKYRMWCDSRNYW